MKIFQFGEASLSVGQSGKMAGAWLNLPDGTCFCLYSCPDQGLVLGYYKNVEQYIHCNVALNIDTDGIHLQYTTKDGELKRV